VIAFHGDSTAYRAASQLDAFLSGAPYRGFVHNRGFQHLVVNGNLTADGKLPDLGAGAFTESLTSST
jgi:hypothetical protein